MGPSAIGSENGNPSSSGGRTPVLEGPDVGPKVPESRAVDHEYGTTMGAPLS